MTEATATSKESFFKLPRGSQLLVAYALINDKWELQLMKSDRDMLGLVNVGWLVANPSSTHGIVNCNFPDDIWDGFESIETNILDSISEDDMARYGQRKGKEYPWLW